MKYLFACTSDKGKCLVKLDIDGKEKWATTSEDVVNYAKSNFQKNEEIDADYTERHGQYHVTSLRKKGATKTSAPVASATPSSAPTCSVCGKALKDAKYKKCYDCNKKPSTDAPASSPSTPTGNGGQRDTVGKSIERQAMMKASADAVATAMQGQISDVDVLVTMIISVYDRLLAKITE